MGEFTYCDLEYGCAICEGCAEIDAWDAIRAELTALFAGEVYGGQV